jgi:hypothetical protein
MPLYASRFQKNTLILWEKVVRDCIEFPQLLKFRRFLPGADWPIGHAPKDRGPKCVGRRKKDNGPPPFFFFVTSLDGQSKCLSPNSPFNKFFSL